MKWTMNWTMSKLAYLPATFALTLALALSLLPAEALAAGCTADNGTTCSGPCCSAGPDWCKAGACRPEV